MSSLMTPLRPWTAQGAEHLLVGVEVMARGARAEQDVVRTIRGEHHLQQLGEVLLVGNILGVVKDVEQVVLLKTVAELLDGLGTNAVDAEQVLLGLAHEVTDDLNADLAELVGPTLGNTQVIEEIEARVLGGDGTAIAVNWPPSPPYSPAPKSSCCGSSSSSSLSSSGAQSGSTLACGEVGFSMAW